MNGLPALWPLVWERLLANWRLLLVLAFGILVAATLLAASPVYTRVMNDLGLRVALEQQIGSATRNTLFTFGPLGAPEAAEKRRELTRLASEEIGWLTRAEGRYARLEDMTLGRDGQALSTDQFRPIVSLQTLANYESQVRVTEGRLPQTTDDPTRIEVALPAATARVLGARIGDRFYAGQNLDDCNRPPPTDDPEQAAAFARFRCTPQTFATLQAPFTVAGFIEPIDAESNFWTGAALSFAAPSGSETAGPTFPVLVPERTFFTALMQLLPRVGGEYRFTSFADLGRLDSAKLPRARESLLRLRERAEAAGAVPDLALAGPLQDFNRRASFNQVTLLLLLLQVVGIAVYYVLLVTSLLAERRAEEVAVLRSRGATVLQLVALAGIEAVALGLVAALIAPFLASAVIAGLGKTGTFEVVSGGRWLDFVLVPQSFLLAIGGAGLAILAIVVPSFFAARRGLVVFLRGAARPGVPFMQRYYVDVALVALAALALWELNQRGSVFDPRSVGGWSADPLLLASPFLLMLAVGALLFRFLPIVLKIVSRVMAVTSGPGATLGLWQLTRSPARYTQLALLVVMAAAVGTFAATYGATTDKSQEERARFSAGVDIRSRGLGTLDRSKPAQIRERLEAIPGVESSAAAYRGSLALGPLPSFGERIDILGVDPERASDLVWFREDFAGSDLESMMLALRGSPAGGAGLVLMGEPPGVSLYANPTMERPSSTLWLRSLDSNGVFRLHEFGRLDFTGYRQMTATFSANDGIQYPLSIVGLLLTQPEAGVDPTRGNLLVDDISITVAGEEQVVEDFEGPFRWDAIRTATRNRDIAALSNSGTYRGQGAAQLGFRVGSSTQVRGLFVSDPNLPMPVIASERFLALTGRRIGDEIELVLGPVVAPLTIQGSVDLFPTMDDANPGFLIVNQEHLYYFAGLANQSNAVGPNEAWLGLSGDAETRVEVIRQLQERFNLLSAQLVDVERALEETRSDPIVRAGGSGVLLIALIAAFAILALGFGLTLYLGGQGRALEVSVLRAVGLSSRQVFSMIALEYLLVAGIGLAVGTVAGLRISETMLSFLNVTAEGTRVIPPFSLVTQWDTVGLAFVATGVAFLTGVVALGVYFLRLPVGRFLRLTR